jgi:hypothetical protein
VREPCASCLLNVRSPEFLMARKSRQVRQSARMKPPTPTIDVPSTSGDAFMLQSREDPT